MTTRGKQIMKRKRSKMTRYNPDHVQAVRSEIAKCPNKEFAKMVDVDSMSDGDMLDFALHMTFSYFNGSLLETARQATVNLIAETKQQSEDKAVLMIDRAILKTLGAFGLTATISEDGLITPQLARSKDDPKVQIESVQRLVDTGLSVAESVASIRELPAPGELPDRIEAQVSQPEVTH